jgi:membrane associated rhomboid family serine protease
VLVWLITLIPGVGAVLFNTFAFAPIFLDPDAPYGFQPWRALTSALVHSQANILHLGLNMLSLWLMGRILEPLLGPVRFLLLYVLSVLGGSAAVALIAPNDLVVGASGGIFGLFGALLVIGRHLGANVTGIAILIGVNFAWPFLFAIPAAIETGSFALGLQSVQVSWQAHLGGVIAGILIGLVYAATRARARRPLQIGLLVGVTVVIVGALALSPIIYG